MSTIVQTMKSALLDALRSSQLAAELRANPEMLELVGDVTLAELCGGAGGRGSSGRGRGRPSQGAAAQPVVAAGGKPNVRTRAGRVAYDAKVLASVKTIGKAGAEQLLRAAGGDIAQLRAALHRLIKGKKVKRTGNTRATRYAVA